MPHGRSNRESHQPPAGNYGDSEKKTCHDRKIPGTGSLEKEVSPFPERGPHHSSLPVVGLPDPTPCSRWGPCPGKAPPPRELCHLESGWRLPSVAGLAFSAKGGVQRRLHLRVRSRQLGKKGKATKRQKTRMAQRAGRDLWLCLSPEHLEAIPGLLTGLTSILLCLKDQRGQGEGPGRAVSGEVRTHAASVGKLCRGTITIATVTITDHR